MRYYIYVAADPRLRTKPRLLNASTPCISGYKQAWINKRMSPAGVGFHFTNVMPQVIHSHFLSPSKPLLLGFVFRHTEQLSHGVCHLPHACLREEVKLIRSFCMKTDNSLRR